MIIAFILPNVSEGGADTFLRWADQQVLDIAAIASGA
jgi:hypothetical protein